jgi:hypothetical protein
MKKIMLGFYLLLCSSLASAAVIGFDDLSGNSAAIADGYQGFNWTTLGSIASDVYPGSGYEAGVVSGNNTAFNFFAEDVSISLASEGSFDFIGAFFTAAWVGDYYHEISFEGWLDGVLVYSLDSAIALADDTPTWIQLDWAGIDQLNIYSNLAGWDFWAMDDFTININSTSVPESSGVVLMLMGLLGMSLLRRRA